MAETRTGTCPECGARFELATTGRPRVYCSRSCARTAQRKAARAGEEAVVREQRQVLTERITALPAPDQALLAALVTWLEQARR